MARQIDCDLDTNAPKDWPKRKATLPMQRQPKSATGRLEILQWFGDQTAQKKARSGWLAGAWTVTLAAAISASLSVQVGEDSMGSELVV